MAVKSTAIIIPIATLAALLTVNAAINALRPRNNSKKCIPSPRETLLPLLTESEIASLPYPPNLLPGSRNVETPYGTMRVYEWGPPGGKKVVLVHGDATPAPLLYPIANGLVDRGCRVIVYDLWGRGYSDSPLNAPHDASLFSLQILFAINSSNVAWTGESSGRFSLIGFSLGGGIAMSFAALFPYLVDSVILLGPAGILRDLPGDYKWQVFKYYYLAPTSYVRRCVGNLLGVNLNKSQKEAEQKALLDEVGDDVPSVQKPTERGTLDFPAIVQWQFDHHDGFLNSFLDGLNNGPIQHQHDTWAKVAANLEEASSQKSKMLVIFGQDDPIVKASEVGEDMAAICGGRGNVNIQIVPGDHSFPATQTAEVVKRITEFWKI